MGWGYSECCGHRCESRPRPSSTHVILVPLRCEAHHHQEWQAGRQAEGQEIVLSHHCYTISHTHTGTELFHTTIIYYICTISYHLPIQVYSFQQMLTNSTKFYILTTPIHSYRLFHHRSTFCDTNQALYLHHHNDRISHRNWSKRNKTSSYHRLQTTAQLCTQIQEQPYLHPNQSIQTREGLWNCSPVYPPDLG